MLWTGAVPLGVAATSFTVTLALFQSSALGSGVSVAVVESTVRSTFTVKV
jgi:hypothetical protein